MKWLKKDGNLQGDFLVASPSITDIRFQRTVILICEMSYNNTFGLNINQSIPFPDPKEYQGKIYGGPVSPNKVFVLKQGTFSEEKKEKNIKITENLFIEKSKKNLTEVEGDFMIIKGYSNWSGNQLEQELKNGFWIPFSDSSNFLFDNKIKDKWKFAINQLGFKQGSFSPFAGEA